MSVTKDKFYDWESMSVSQIIQLMVKWFDFHQVNMTCRSRHQVESGIWFDIEISKQENEQYSISAQRLDLLKHRLIIALDGIWKVREDYLKERVTPTNKTE